MPTDNNYFDVIFASSGDITDVPDDVQPSGAISYAQGWGPYYAQDPTVDPGTALFIDRAQTNQLFFSITAALQYLQQNGAPPFITEAMNGGSPFSYCKGAIVSYGSEPSTVVNWVSAVTMNTSVPGADGNWLELPADVGVLFTGGTSTGSANAQTITTVQGGYDESVAGNIVTWKAGFSNTGATTLNVDGSGVTSLKKMGGVGLVALTAQDIVVGGEYMAITDGTTLQLLNPTYGGVRQKLTAGTSFYVTTTGNDSTGNGTAALPWLTIQHAIDYISANIDTGGFTATVNVADGTYTDAVLVTSSFTGGGTVLLNGNTTTPTNCIVSCTGTCIRAQNSGVLSIQGFSLVSSSGHGVLATNGGIINITGKMNYGTTGGGQSAHIAAGVGGLVSITSNDTVNGGGAYHWYADYASKIVSTNNTTVITGSPTFTLQFVRSSGASCIFASGDTFTGGITGVSYIASANGVIDTLGTGAFPGTAGSTATGGQYL